MRILFLTTPYIVDPLGIGYLSASAKKLGHHVGIEHVENYRRTIDLNTWDIIAFSLTTGQHRIYEGIARDIKGQTQRPIIIWGGPHPTYFPEANVAIDYIVRGEADLSWPQLLKDIDAGNKQERVVMPMPLVQDLDSLPMPDRELIYGFPENARNPLRNVLTSRGCPFCLDINTKILMSDGTVKKICEVKVGEKIIGVKEFNDGRSHIQYMEGEILNKEYVEKEAYKIIMENGREIICSADHKWLTNRGWKKTYFVRNGNKQSAFLTDNNSIRGWGEIEETPQITEEYKKGYLSGVIKGDGTMGAYSFVRDGSRYPVHSFRLAMIDKEPIDRARGFLSSCGIETNAFMMRGNKNTGRDLYAIRTSTKRNYEDIVGLIEFQNDKEYMRGFLSGIFDAEGNGKSMRISNGNSEILEFVQKSLSVWGFRFAFEQATKVQRGSNMLVHNVRILGGIKERVRFYAIINPSIKRKIIIAGKRNQSNVGVRCIIPLNTKMRMVDITTSCENFVAEGLISHNSCPYCYNGSYKALYPNQRIVRTHSINRVIAECDEVKRRWGARFIFFIDDEFTMNDARLSDFADRYTNEIGLPYHAQLRIDLLTDGKAKLLKDSGCVSVTFAIESGGELYRKNVLKRNMSDDQILEGAQILHKYGIKFRTENMLGLPHESFKDAMNTLEVNIKCKPELAWASLYQPYPGTPLGDLCVRDGLFAGSVDDIKPSFFEDSILALPNKRRFVNLQRLFGLVVNFPVLRFLLPLALRIPTNKLYGWLYRTWKVYKYDKKLYSY